MSFLFKICVPYENKNHFKKILNFFFQEDNDEMRKEIDRNREKFEALKRFAMQKKISIPQELNQY